MPLNPRACVRIHAYAHTCLSSTCVCFMHVYTNTGIHAHARVPKTNMEKFSVLKLDLKQISHDLGPPQTPIFDYIKPKMVAF